MGTTAMNVGFALNKSTILVNNCHGFDERVRGDNQRYCPLTELIVESGRNGYKSDFKGWFKYPAGPFTSPQVDPAVTKLIEDYRAKHGIVPRKISDQEIRERMIFSLINQGFEILEDKIASSPMDIDVAWTNGMGWPKYTGGPMFYAQTVGLPYVLKVIQERWEKSEGRELHWKPSKMLTNLVTDHENPDITTWKLLCDGKSVVIKSKVLLFYTCLSLLLIKRVALITLSHH